MKAILILLLAISLFTLTACAATQTATPVPAASATSAPDTAAAESPAATLPPAKPTSTQPRATTVGPMPFEVEGCSPTAEDMLGPFFTPGAPQRTSVGEGYLLSGVVRSAADCSPIAGALIDAWLVGPDGEYADAYRATFYSGADGSFTFSSHPPIAYEGRPPHIHLRVSAPGYAVLVTQHYPASGQTEAQMDLVIVPGG